MNARPGWTPHRPLTRRNLLALAGGATLSLAGCGGSGGSGGGSAKKTPTKAPIQRAGAKVDGPTLRVWADSEFVPRMIEASKPFTQEYQVNLEFQPLGFNDIQTQFLQAAPNGKGPDLIDAAVDWIPALNKGGLLAPIELGGKAAQLDERALTGMTVDDQVYGLPLTVESINIWRDTKLVPEPVTTWDQMNEVATELKGNGVKFPFLMENDPNNAYLFIGMITAFGGYCFKRQADGSYDVGDVGLDNDGAIAALDWLRQAREKGWTGPGITADVATKTFKDGQGGVELSGPWRLEQYRDTSYAIDPLPAGPGGPARPFLGCRGLMVNKFSEQVVLASTFLTEFWASEAPMQAYSASTGKESAWLPVKKTEDDKDVKAFISASSDAEIIPTVPELAQYWPAVAKALDLTTGKDRGVTPAQAMKDAAAQVRKGASGG